MCPAGYSWEQIRENLLAGKTCLTPMADWEVVHGLRPRLCGTVPPFEKPPHYTRKKVRSMGQVALMATLTTEWALQHCQIAEEYLGSGNVGIAYGSTIGAEPAIRKFAERIGFNNTLTGITGATFIQLMSHTCAANLAQFFGIKGRVLPTNAGDTSGSQGIGYGFETITSGQQDIMVAGGSEALSMVGASFFDMLGAASCASDPTQSPRPFDQNRDGLVISEGAATLILESKGHAESRGALPQGRILAYSSLCDRPRHLHPNRDKLAQAMTMALEQAGIGAHEIGFVHAHGLGHREADIEESWAIYDVFGATVPVINLKSYFGHTQAACAAIESWLSLHLLNEGWIPPILSLTSPDTECAPLCYVRSMQSISKPYALVVTYSYSGVITVLILGAAP